MTSFVRGRAGVPYTAAFPGSALTPPRSRQQGDCRLYCTRHRAAPARILRSACSTAVRAGSAVCFTDSGSISTSPAVRSFDFLVLGSGIAGLSYALKVAEYGSVAIVTKAAAAEGCTRWAQGGISAVLASSDSPESHIKDTLVAGDYVNDRRYTSLSPGTDSAYLAVGMAKASSPCTCGAVCTADTRALLDSATEVVCRQGPAAVLELAELGANFTRTGQLGPLHLTREGGHTHRRVVHAADATGAEVERALLSAASANRNIRFFEHHLAVDLVLDEVGSYANHTPAQARHFLLHQKTAHLYCSACRLPGA